VLLPRLETPSDVWRETPLEPVPEPVPPSKTRPKVSPFVSRYRAFCYRFFGDRLDEGWNAPELSDALRQAGIEVTPGLHRSVVLVTTVLATIVVAIVSTVLFFGILHAPAWYEFAGAVTGVTALSSVLAFRFLISSRISNRRSQLEKELPFTLSELSVLASTGMPPIQLVRRMANRHHDPAVTEQFRAVVYRSDIQGKDLITALSETAKESPSLPLREALWDLANMIHQGGDLDSYLRQKSDDVLKLKRIIQKEFIERLQTFVDMYISLVLVGVLMIAVGAFLINAFGSTAGGLSADELLLLLTYGMVPLAVTITTILISIAYARTE
jgi:flagellar protein FlaJ